MVGRDNGGEQAAAKTTSFNGTPGRTRVLSPQPSSTPALSDTRERILDAAEKAFMEHGYEGTSMRTITAAAAVNLAAVNYHFGSKEGLMCAVFRRRLDGLNEERLAALDALEREAAGAPLKPSQILEAFFGTLLRIGEDERRGGMTFLRLLGRTLTDPADFIRAFFAQEYKDVIVRYKRALFQALPDVPRAEIAWRLHFMLGAVSYAIAGTDILQVITGTDVNDLSREDGESVTPALLSSAGGRNEANEARHLAERMMPFLLGGLRAPLPGSAAECSAQGTASNASH